LQHLDRLLAKLRDPEPHARILAHLIICVLVSRCSGEHQIDVAYKALEVMDIETLGVTTKAGEVADVCFTRRFTDIVTDSNGMLGPW
jgi:hypothetical protein